MKYALLSIIGVGVLAGCSSIIEGTSQEITVNTTPAGANCSLERQGISIARIDPTPGAATIKKTKYDITIKCNKRGYQEATYINHSGAAGATVGNIILGGGIGWAIDSAAGADNKYDTPVNMTLVPEETTNKHKKHESPATTDDSGAQSSDDDKSTVNRDNKPSDNGNWPSSKR